MPGELLTKYLMEKLVEEQPEIKIQNENSIEEVVFKNPFHTIDEIFEDVLPSVETNEFYAISFIGTQGHGKTHSAAGLATKAKKKGFLVVYAKAADIFPDLKGWIDKVKEKLKEHGIAKLCFLRN